MAATVPQSNETLCFCSCPTNGRKMEGGKNVLCLLASIEVEKEAPEACGPPPDSRTGPVSPGPPSAPPAQGPPMIGEPFPMQHGHGRRHWFAPSTRGHCIAVAAVSLPSNKDCIRCIRWQSSQAHPDRGGLAISSATFAPTKTHSDHIRPDRQPQKQRRSAPESVLCMMLGSKREMRSTYLPRRPQLLKLGRDAAR